MFRRFVTNSISLRAALYLVKRFGSFQVERSNTKFVHRVSNRKVLRKMNALSRLTEGKRVVHFGFADHPFTKKSVQSKLFLHSYLRTKCESILGVDNNPEAIKTYCSVTKDSNVLCMDIHELEENYVKFSSYEVFLLGEILEHLENPLMALISLYRSMPKSSQLIVTVPNSYSLRSFSASLSNIDLVHAQHFYWFSPSTLKNLVVRCGYKYEDMAFYVPGRDAKVEWIYRKYPLLSDGIIGIFRKT